MAATLPIPDTAKMTVSGNLTLTPQKSEQLAPEAAKPTQQQRDVSDNLSRDDPPAAAQPPTPVAPTSSPDPAPSQ